MRTRRRVTASAGVILAIGVSACGESSRDEVADMYVEVATQDGFAMDRSCVRQVLGAMSSDDLDELQRAGLDGNADLSQQGLRVLADVANQCADVDQYIDVVMDDLESDPAINPATNLACVDATLRDYTSIDQVDNELPEVLISCTKPA